MTVGVKTDHGVFSLFIIKVGKDAIYVDLAAHVAADFLKELVCLYADNDLDGGLLPEHPGNEAPVVHHAEGYLLVNNNHDGVLDPLPLVVLEHNVLVLHLVV